MRYPRNVRPTRTEISFSSFLRIARSLDLSCHRHSGKLLVGSSLQVSPWSSLQRRLVLKNQNHPPALLGITSQSQAPAVWILGDPTIDRPSLRQRPFRAVHTTAGWSRIDHSATPALEAWYCVPLIGISLESNDSRPTLPMNRSL
jgi:hypothetical protein